MEEVYFQSGWKGPTVHLYRVRQRWRKGTCYISQSCFYKNSLIVIFNSSYQFCILELKNVVIGFRHYQSWKWKFETNLLQNLVRLPHKISLASNFGNILVSVWWNTSIHDKWVNFATIVYFFFWSHKKKILIRQAPNNSKCGETFLEYLGVFLPNEGWRSPWWRKTSFLGSRVQKKQTM